MNKLGFYVENTTVPFLRDALRKVKPPVLLVHAQDRGLLREIRNTLSPDTFVIGRLYLTPAEQSAMLSGGDPEGAGRAFAERIINYDFQMAKEKGNNGRLLIDAWMSLNEPVRGPASFPSGQPDAETLARYDALDRFQASFLQRLRADGLEGVAFNFAAGNFTGKDDIARYFPRTLAAYTYLGLHEYGWPWLMPRPDASTSALTYRTVMEGIRERYGNRHKLIITEAGLARMYRYPHDPAGDVGWLYKGETISENQYWQSLDWYNNQMVQDDYVMGASLYQVGHGGRWETFRHLGVNNEQQPILLMDKIATLNTTVQPPPPPPPPPPPDEREKLLARVKAVQAAMQATTAAADAFDADRGKARAALTQAGQASAPAPTPLQVQVLLDRLAALEAALNDLPPGSSIDPARVRGQIAALRGQTNALLAGAQGVAGLKAKLVPAQARLAALDAKAPEVAKTKQAAGQVLAQANALAGELQGAPAPLAVERGLAPTEGPAVQDVAAGAAAIVPEPGPSRPLSDIRRILIHHTGMAPDATPEAVVRRATSNDRAGLPYHYLVGGDGAVYQLADLDVAVNQSRLAAVDADAVGVALGGDFDLAAPSEAQMAAAVELVAALLGELGLHVNDIYGRAELEGGTTSPGLQWTQGVRWGDDLVARVAAMMPRP